MNDERKGKKTIFKKTLFLEQKRNLYYNFATEFTVFFNSFFGGNKQEL